MGFRPRDLCTAAFENDVRRLRLLATSDGVPGGYANEPPTEEEEEAIEQDEEMTRLHQLFVSKQLQEDVGDDEGDLFAEEEEAQAELMTAYRALIRNKLRHGAIAARLNVPGLLQAGGTTPASARPYGVLFQAREGEVFGSLTDGEQEGTRLAVNWKPSKRSAFTATPLLWAVLGRAHDAVDYLILNGADVQCGVGQAHDGAKASDSTTGASDTSAVFPCGLTAEIVAKDNGSYETLKAIVSAVQKRDAAACRAEERKRKIESELEQIKARREKRRLEMDQRRSAAEEAEEEEEGEEQSGDDGGY